MSFKSISKFSSYSGNKLTDKGVKTSPRHPPTCGGGKHQLKSCRRWRIDSIPITLARPRELYSGHFHCQSSRTTSRIAGTPRASPGKAAADDTTTSTHRHRHRPTPTARHSIHFRGLLYFAAPCILV